MASHRCSLESASIASLRAVNSVPLFDLASLDSRAAVSPGGTAVFDALQSELVLDCLMVATDRWRWAAMSDSEWDALEVSIADALESVMMSSIIGTIVWRPGDALDNELVCDGSQYDRVDYPILYDRLDSSYIVDADTFSVPNLQDAFALGAGSAYSVGDTGGEATHTLSGAEMPVHTHGYTTPIPNVDLEAPGVPDIVAAGIGPVVSTGSAGGGAAHNNLPPYEALTPCLIAR